MINPRNVVEHLRGLGTSLFVGVPDSLLKPFGQYVMAELPRSSHIITSNEGASVAVALGHYMRTKNPALVYLQNSGIGNTVNPLLSLADRAVYGIPMVLMVGWRGQPGVKDEPQHVTQGRVMTAMLDAMELPYAVVPHDEAGAFAAFTTAHETAIAEQSPYVLLVEKDTFEPYSGTKGNDTTPDLPSREEAVAALLDVVADDALIVSTTGMLSRELFELREKSGADGATDFLTVGGMGHASAIALGVAAAEPDREVWCFDGDGAMLMHTGTMATIGDHGTPNLRHALFNNGVHDSVGGQPTSINVVDIPAVALAMNYRSAQTASSLDDLPAIASAMSAAGGPSLVELVVRPGSRPDLGRPTRTPRESRDRFMGA
jgi:phosphonopyruvate decarboxylase